MTIQNTSPTIGLIFFISRFIFFDLWAGVNLLIIDLLKLVVLIGSMDADMDDIALGINQKLAFAPLDLFSPVKATFASGFGCRDALTIDDHHARLIRALGMRAVLSPQAVHDALPCAIIRPFDRESA